MKSLASSGALVVCLGGTYGEGVLAGLDLLVGELDLVGLEGRAAEEEGEADDAHRPDVHLVGVPHRPLHDLGSDVVGRAAHGALLLLAELQLGGESEVAHLDLHVGVEEDVAELEVAVDDAVAVHVLDCGDELQHEVARLLGGEPLALLDHLAEGLREGGVPC